MPRNVGRVRHAIHIVMPTASPMTVPKATNMRARVNRLVVNTSVLSTDLNHSQSV